MAHHNGDGFWPKGEEPVTPHPFCRCYLEPRTEDSESFKGRLKEWLKDPGSQPDIEQWYDGTARPFLERPAPNYMTSGTAGGGGRLDAGSGGDGGMHPIDQLILEIAQTGRPAERAELDQILQHVAVTGFPDSDDPAGPRLRGIEWEGRILRDTDRPPYAVTQYLRHVIANREWPSGTSLAGYLSSIKDIILDSDSGVAVSQWQGREWRLTIVCRSGSLRGPGGYEWVMVEYSPLGGYWVTAYQMELGLKQLTMSTRRRMGFRWLRDPK